MDLTLPYWKRIWQTITAKSKHISNKAVVTDLLTETGNDLCTGLVVYKAFTQSEFEPWIKKMKKAETNRVFERFFFVFVKHSYVNLEPSVAWNVLCNFLMYEYYGKVSDIEDLARYETNAAKLIENIWIFYTSERMFLVKTMRFILEHYTDKSNQFHETYAEYVQSKTLGSLRKQLLEELKYLIDEINPSHASNCITMKDWVDRNNREQLENVLSLIVCLNNEEFPMEDFVHMLKLFVKHDFANSPSYIKNVCVGDPGFERVNSIELGAFLVGLESCWRNSERWRKYEKEIENLINEIAKVGDHSVLLLTWATLHASLNNPEDVEIYNTNYSELPINAFEGCVFATLNRMARDASRFSCAGGKLILNSIFTLYNYVCYNFNDDDYMFIQNDAVELLMELFKEEQLARSCFGNQEQPVKSIFTFAMKLFPYNFTYLTNFALTLVSHPFYAKKVMETLCSMSTYAEEHDNRISDLESVIININYNPISGNKLIVFPKGTEVVGMRKFGKKFLIFKSPYSYFNVLLHQMGLLLSNLEQHKDLDEDLLENVTAGYRLVCEIFRKCDVNNLKYVQIQSCLNILDKLANILNQAHFRHVPLMKLFFEIVTAVSVSDCHLKVDIHNTAILPKLLKFEIKVEHCFQTDILSRGVLMSYLIEEEQTDTHDLLCLYIEFLSNAVMKNVNHMQVQIPGLIYMMRTVFPNHYEWKYSNIVQKYKITNECLKLFLKVLSQNRKDIENENQKLIFDFCLQASLHDDFTVKGYINIFKITNLNIQLEMEKETNWEDGETTVLIGTMKMLFTLVLLLMKYNRYNKRSEQHSVFQKQLMYSTVNGTNIIKVIAGYIHHSFDFTIQKLAVRVLKNWAADLPLPLFGPLDWDNYQLQRLFLEKLRDPLESEDLKLAIIDLIGISIQHQPGLTGAFFNVKSQHKRINLYGKKAESGESVADFMIDYLQNIKKSTEILKNPLQHAILDVIHRLWDSHKSGLIQDVINLDEFWSILADPIFHDIKLDNKLYGLIFGIFSIELHENGKNVSKKLLTVIKKYLDVNENHLKRWRDHLVLTSRPVNLIMETDQFNQHIIPSELYLLSSWKSFIMFSIQYAPDFYKNEKIRSLIAETCLDALLSHFSAPDEIRIIRIWSDIYLFCINQWYNTETKYDNAENLLIKLTAVLERLINYYVIVDNHCKETILAATSKSIVILKDFMNKNSGLVDKFLAPLGKILDVEYNNLDIKKPRKMEDEIEIPEQLLNWVLILSIGNNLLTLQNIETHSLWFDSYHFLHRVLSCIGPFIKSGNALPVAKVAVQTLIICVQSPLGKMFLNIPLHSFYDEIVPPAEYTTHANVNEKTASFVREWWVTYGEIIKLHNLMLSKFGCLIAKQCFSFLFLHDEILASSINLPNVTVDPAALSLVCLCLQFCNNMLTWKENWIMMNTTSFYRIVNAAQEAINSTNSIILRPRILQFINLEEKSVVLTTTQLPKEMVIDLINMLIEIIALSFSCLVKSDPNILCFVDTTDEETSSCFDVELDFHVPGIQHGRVEGDTLTYGGLICLLQFLCKMLTKLTMRGSQKPGRKEGSSLSTTHTKANVAKPKSLQTIVTTTIDTKQVFIGLIKLNDTEGAPQEKINSIQRFASSGFSFLQTPLLERINPILVRTAIEKLTTFLATQVYLDVTDDSNAANMKQYIKRELHSELQFFIDFVKKRMYEQFDSSNVLPKISRRNDSEADHIRLSKILNSTFPNTSADVEIHDEYLYVMAHWFSNICQLNN